MAQGFSHLDIMKMLVKSFSHSSVFYLWYFLQMCIVQLVICKSSLSVIRKSAGRCVGASICTDFFVMMK